jgi:hypothetical protein
MNPLNLSVLFHLLTALPGDFSYDRDSMKVVSSTDPSLSSYSDEGCRDSLFFQVGLDAEIKNYIISFCPEDEKPSGWRVYRALRVESMNRFLTLENMLNEFGGLLNLFQLKSGHRLLYLDSPGKKQLFYLSPGKSMIIKNFISLQENKSFLFSFNQQWYFLFTHSDKTQGSRKAVLESLKKGLPFLGAGKEISSDKISALYYIDKERLVIFSLADSKEYAIYSIQYERWINLPQQQLISEEDRTILEKMGSMLKVQSTLPGLNRVYYEVYVNGKKVIKTPFQTETEIVKIPISLKTGSCTIQLVRFIAFEDDNGKYYKRDRNLYQPEPVTFEVQDNFQYMLKLERAKDSENKPLSISVLPIKKN